MFSDTSILFIQIQSTPLDRNKNLCVISNMYFINVKYVDNELQGMIFIQLKYG